MPVNLTFILNLFPKVILNLGVAMGQITRPIYPHPTPRRIFLSSGHDRKKIPVTIFHFGVKRLKRTIAGTAK